MFRRKKCPGKQTLRLLDVLHRATDARNTVIVVEHNLDVIKTADWIIDLGPEGGDEGGMIRTTHAGDPHPRRGTGRCQLRPLPRLRLRQA